MMHKLVPDILPEENDIAEMRTRKSTSEATKASKRRQQMNAKASLNHKKRNEQGHAVSSSKVKVHENRNRR